MLDRWKQRFFISNQCKIFYNSMNKTTTKIKMLLQKNTYEEVAEKIGITRPTLYTRLQKHNWKVSEISHISRL